MSAEPAHGLHTSEGQRVPLTGVTASGHLDGLLFELTVEQHYRNTSPAPIETVFTFPLPLHAVLLAFELELDGKRHVVMAFGRGEAERQYENAIDDGDSAALLVQNGNGLYTVNVANLKPGEEATVRYRYAELLLDCSGSMAGGSIQAAKRALIQLLGGLNETDTFSLTRFGSYVEHVTEGMEPADAHSIKPVTQLVQRMEANLGGTGMPAEARRKGPACVEGSAVTRCTGSRPALFRRYSADRRHRCARPRADTHGHDQRAGCRFHRGRDSCDPRASGDAGCGSGAAVWRTY